jgi:hypothetical protein
MMMTGMLKKEADVNVWSHGEKTKKVWKLFVNGDFFAKYASKEKAMKDAEKYGIKI